MGHVLAGAAVDVVVGNGGELFWGDDGVVVVTRVSAVVGAVALALVAMAVEVMVVLEIC